MEMLAKQGLALDDVPEEGQLRPAQADRQHEHRRHLDRPHRRHPPRQRRDRPAGGDGRRARRRRHRLHHPRHRPLRARAAAAAIVEVNAGPGFRMHTHPTEGHPRHVGRAVIDMLFPPGSPSRVPIVAVTGTNGKTTTSRMIAHIMKTAGKKVGMTTTDGIYIDGTQIAAGDMSGPTSRADGAEEPDHRLRRAGDGARRHPPLRSRLRPLRHRGGHQRRRRTTSGCRGSTRSPSWRGSRRSCRSRSSATAPACSTPTTTTPSRWRGSPAARSSSSRWTRRTRSSASTCASGARRSCCARPGTAR